MIKKIPRHHEQAVEVLASVFGDRQIVGVEIGTNAGDLTKTLLRDLPNLKRLVTVDPWTHVDGAQFEAGNTQEYHNEQKACALHKTKEFGQRCKVIQDTSDNAFEEIKKSGIKVDFIWIDGHHAKEQVERDIANAIACVIGRKPSLVGGHDYGLVGDVTEVVDAIFPVHHVHKGGDFTWWVIYE